MLALLLMTVKRVLELTFVSFELSKFLLLVFFVSFFLNVLTLIGNHILTIPFKLDLPCLHG